LCWIDNAAWQLILAQKSEAIDEVYKEGHLTLDAYGYEMLKTVRTVPGSHSEVMIVGNGAAGIFRLTVDKFTQVMFSTTGKERTQVFDDLENGVDVIESIQRLVVGDRSAQLVSQLHRLIYEAMESGTSYAEVQRMVLESARRIESYAHPSY
jgi:hypothetical protein